MAESEIRRRRMALGMSSMDLAVKAQLSFNHLCKLERGRVASPRRATLARIARALKCSPEELS